MMTSMRWLSLPAALALALLNGCTPSTSAAPGAKDAAAIAQGARELVQRVNDESYERQRESSAAGWIAATYINDDSQLLAAKAQERDLGYQAGVLAEARRYTDAKVDHDTRRAFDLMLKGNTVLPPARADDQAELTRLSTGLEAHYGSAKACADPAKPETCRDLIELSRVLAESRDPAALRQAWIDWHNTASGQKQDFQRFAELMNAGAREYGFKDTGDLWRARYDMSGEDFALETERLWSQVQPLYTSLQCYVRTRLNQHYGDTEVPKTGLIPAHLLGNMWQQDWSAVYPLVEPYPGVASLDVSGGLKKAGYDAVELTRQAEGFYTSLGMPSLPESFWQKSMLTKPGDREVQCHASAWDIDMKGDVRIKMCIEPDEDSLRTIYHELGHVYYYLAYHDLPPLFQTGANDGFHEAIGDTVLLSLTPGYLARIGLIDAPEQSEQALINAQMKLALEKIAFLPFGKLIDQWRWGVFDGSIAPDRYNSSWWELKARYQGVQPPVARGEDYFDAAAKYHVPANTPYTRYFLAHILQFQMHRELCRASGHQGPLHSCSIFDNKKAGDKFWAMLGKGASQPWQQTIQEFSGSGKMDADAVIEYFKPLSAWLDQQNAGQNCGW
ncbi:MAG TPA: M2 family metallopeptidase [Xanthomonadales bacterium]|nr:M2 family metallopeptidase [Xanthomonadales bacterium]